MSNFPEYKGFPVLSFGLDTVTVVFKHPYHTPFSSETQQAITMFHVKENEALPAQVIGVYSRVPGVIHQLIKDLQYAVENESLEFWQKNLVNYTVTLLRDLTDKKTTD